MPRMTTKKEDTNFLGFTIHWRQSPSGRWNVKMRTAKDRFRRALAGIVEWCKANRHAPLDEQRRALNHRLRRPLQLLRSSGQPRPSVGSSSASGTRVEAVVEPTLAMRSTHVGIDETAAPALPAGAAGIAIPPRVANACLEEPSTQQFCTSGSVGASGRPGATRILFSRSPHMT
jgi:hypothetical protein